MTKVGAVIVTHNSAEVLQACLRAVIPHVDQVVVVDNNSCDDTLAVARRHSEVHVIENRWNAGFAAAANQGFEYLDAFTHVLLLNPDVELLTPLAPLLRATEAPAVAGSCGQLIGPDGLPQIGFMIRRLPTPVSLAFEALGLNAVFPWNPVNCKYRCLNLDYQQYLDVEQPAGAFMLIRREIWQQLGGFDEQFWPVWFEDVDFCARCRQAGLRFRYVPCVRARHLGAQSIQKINKDLQEVYWYANFLRYSARYFGQASFRLVCLAVALGQLGRGMYERLRGLKRVRWQVRWHIFREAMHQLFAPDLKRLPHKLATTQVTNIPS